MSDHDCCRDCPSPALCSSKGCHGMAWGDAVHDEMAALRAERDALKVELALLRELVEPTRGLMRHLGLGEGTRGDAVHAALVKLDALSSLPSAGGHD